MTENKEIIHSEIKKASVKIFINTEFKGTGFFITDDGYVLTAYHCIKDYELGIKLETSTGEKLKAEIDEDTLKKTDLKNQRVATLRQHQELLNKKLSILEQQYYLETHSDEKFRLENIINETKTACQQLETEINSLES